MFSFVNSYLFSDDISYLIFNDVEPFEFRDCRLSGMLHDRVVIGRCRDRAYACRIDRLFQPAPAKIVILVTERNIILSADVVQHGEQIQAFGIPFALIISADFIPLQSVQDIINIPKQYIAKKLSPTLPALV